MNPEKKCPATGCPYHADCIGLDKNGECPGKSGFPFPPTETTGSPPGTSLKRVTQGAAKKIVERRFFGLDTQI